jgi:signal transduction histidine kinase/response regulator RpfG family c-di-GMP phosphodiesterase
MTESLSRPKVLVVDDEPQILQSIQDLLEEDFEVVTTTDATQAVNVLRNTGVAVILADQRMPKLPGDQFLKQAREMCDATRILVTGYTDIDALIRAVNDGQIHSYVPKPWDPASLRVTVLKAATQSDEIVRRKRIVAEQQETLTRSEAAYRQQTRILRSVLDSISDGVLVADDAGKVLVLNPAATQMVGPSAGNDAGNDVGNDAGSVPGSGQDDQYGIYLPGTSSLYPPEQLPLARARRGEVADGIELYVRNAQKPEGGYVSVNVRPLKDDTGKIGGGVAVIRDITDSKLSEEALWEAKDEAERANRAKSEFLSRMSHELRTPLNSILGFAQLLALSELPARQQDNIQLILKGGYHLLELINEVLDLARIESGRLTVSLEPVGVGEVVTEVLDLVRPIAAGRNIVLNSDLEGRGRCYIRADRQRLKQVLLNLLSNAIKFNRADGLISLACRKRGSDRLVFEVSDTGPGIDEEGLRKLFVPFERLDADRNAVAGTGLGLALSKRMIEAMGGTMGVESALGIGSKFHFELALADHDANRAEPVRSPEISACLDGGESVRGTVLYIEDNQANVQLIEEIMSRYPRVRLLVAMRGELGLALAHTQMPDWILLDLHLPDMHGEEVLRGLRNDPLAATIPVTILSADATSGQISNLKASGAREYLTKPVNVRQFMELLERTLWRGERAPVSAKSEDGPAQHESPVSALDKGAFSVLPAELIEQMRIAVQEGQKGRLDELIADALNRHAPSARALKELADNYDYDALNKLLTTRA